jgi:hypothetical protein
MPNKSLRKRLKMIVMRDPSGPSRTPNASNYSNSLFEDQTRDRRPYYNLYWCSTAASQYLRARSFGQDFAARSAR